MKTFAATIIASAGIQASTLFATNGTGASDSCVVIGSSVASGSMNANAKVLDVGVGIGTTFVRSFYVTKDGVFVGGGAVMRLNDTSGAVLSYAAQSIAIGASIVVTGPQNNTSTLQLGTAGTARPTANAASRGTLWYSLSAGGAADTIQMCLKSAADTYSWVTISTG